MKLLPAMTLIAAAMLSACSGGAGTGTPAAPAAPAAANEVPASATASPSAWTQYTGSLARSETDEPKSVQQLTPPTSETDQPQPI
jgi:hypothetical protein